MMKQHKNKLGDDPVSGPALADLEARLAEFADDAAWTPRAGRRSFREKLGAGLRGLKYAFRGDSSFFAHSYRGLFFALTAVLLGLGPHQWCLLLIAAGLVFVAELAHSAVDNLARALGDPDSPGLEVAREVATAGVLVAVVVFAIVAVVVFIARMTVLYGW
jgi:diacylglycerol kinase